jgi:hypothetical protein
MKNWEFNELIEAIKENFISFIEGGAEIGQVTERCFYEFENVANEGYCEKIIIYSTIGILLTSATKISQRRYNKLMEVLKDYDETKILSDLKDSEAKELSLQVKNVISILSKLEIQ